MHSAAIRLCISRFPAVKASGKNWDWRRTSTKPRPNTMRPCASAPGRVRRYSLARGWERKSDRSGRFLRDQWLEAKRAATKWASSRISGCNMRHAFLKPEATNFRRTSNRVTTPKPATPITNRCCGFWNGDVNPQKMKGNPLTLRCTPSFFVDFRSESTKNEAIHCLGAKLQLLSAKPATPVSNKFPALRIKSNRVQP